MEITEMIGGICGIAGFAIGTAVVCAILGGNRRFDEDEEERLSALEVHQLITDERKE